MRMVALTYLTVFILVVGIAGLVWAARWPHSRDRRLALITGHDICSGAHNLRGIYDAEVMRSQTRCHPAKGSAVAAAHSPM